MSDKSHRFVFCILHGRDIESRVKIIYISFITSLKGPYPCMTTLVSGAPLLQIVLIIILNESFLTNRKLWAFLLMYLKTSSRFFSFRFCMRSASKSLVKSNVKNLFNRCIIFNIIIIQDALVILWDFLELILII